MNQVPGQVTSGRVISLLLAVWAACHVNHREGITPRVASILRPVPIAVNELSAFLLVETSWTELLLVLQRGTIYQEVHVAHHEGSTLCPDVVLAVLHVEEVVWWRLQERMLAVEDLSGHVPLVEIP